MPGNKIRKRFPIAFQTVEKYALEHSKVLKSGGFPSGARKDREEPFEATSYLFMCAHENDGGDRPATGEFWLSPDLDVLASDGSEMISGIRAGTRYSIRCRVHNEGDLDAPSATVEILLVDPTLGASVSGAKQIGIRTVYVPITDGTPFEVVFDWTAGNDDAGHRCMFARVYGFSPYDVPADFGALDACNDRHVVQQNLNIVAQSQEMQFCLEPPRARPAARELPFEVAIAPAQSLPARFAERPLLKGLRFKADVTAAPFEIKPITLRMPPSTKVAVVKAAGNHWTGKLAGHSEAVLSLQIPALGLKKGEAAAYDVVQRVPGTKAVVGGFTIVVRG